MTGTITEPGSPGKIIKLKAPVGINELKNLRAGDEVSLSGYLLGARDEAHKRMVKSLEKNEKLPVELKNQVIFYLGPSPVPPGKSSGSIGPTTSSRMDNLTEPLLKSGVSAAIGKGERSLKTKKLFKKYMAVYFVAPGGVSAYLARKVKKIDQAAYKDLGPEAIFRLEVEDLPLFVAYDIHGGDVFHSAI